MWCESNYAIAPAGVLVGPSTFGRVYRRGLGASNPPSMTTQAITGAAGGAMIGITTATQTGSPIAGAIAGGLMTVAPFTGPAAPVLMAAAALVAPLAKMFMGCGSSCTEATKYANQFSDTLSKLNSFYWDQPVRYASVQAQTLSYMDQAAQLLYQLCSNPQLGAAGQRCISERLIKGGTAPWCNKPNNIGCDWITTYRDPIAADTGVVDDSAGSVGGTVGQVLATNVGSTNVGSLLLPLAVLGVGVFLVMGGRD